MGTRNNTNRPSSPQVDAHLPLFTVYQIRSPFHASSSYSYLSFLHNVVQQYLHSIIRGDHPPFPPSSTGRRENPLPEPAFPPSQHSPHTLLYALAKRQTKQERTQDPKWPKGSAHSRSVLLPSSSYFFFLIHAPAPLTTRNTKNKAHPKKTYRLLPLPNALPGTHARPVGQAVRRPLLRLARKPAVRDRLGREHSQGPDGD